MECYQLHQELSILTLLGYLQYDYSLCVIKTRASRSKTSSLKPLSSLGKRRPERQRTNMTSRITDRDQGAHLGHWGEEDHFYPIRETAARIPNAELIFYEGFGHNTMFDNKRQFQEDFLMFLKRVRRGHLAATQKPII